MSFNSSLHNYFNSSYPNAQTVGESFPNVPFEVFNNITLSLLGPTSQVYQPSVSQTTLTVVCNLIGPTSTVNLPTITQTTDATVIIPAWNTSTVVYPPTIQTGAINIVLEGIASTLVFYPPTVLLEGGLQDTSDILNRNLRQQKRAEEIYEENIAAQILKKRRYDEEQKRKKKKKKLTAQQKFEVLVQQVAPEFRNTKQKRIKALLLLATMDD